jgi:hypothetical protein
MAQKLAQKVAQKLPKQSSNRYPRVPRDLWGMLNVTPKKSHIPMGGLGKWVGMWAKNGYPVGGLSIEIESPTNMPMKISPNTQSPTHPPICMSNRAQ